MKRMIVVIMGFLLIPVLALSQEASIVSDVGANVNIALDQPAQTTYEWNV